MKSFIKIIALTISTVLVLTLFAGCGSNKTSDSSTLSAVASLETTKATEATKAPAMEVGKISYYGFAEWITDPKLAPVYKELKDTFEKNFPGAELDITSDPWPTWFDKSKVMFASGNAPDVILLDNSSVPPFSNAGNLLDLGAKLGNDYFTEFQQGILDSMYTWNGKRIALPFTMDARILYYNKELFKKAGLDPEAPPKTWDELKSAAAALTKTGVYGFSVPLGLKAIPNLGLMCASNINLINVDASGKATSGVNTPDFKKYMQLCVDMKPYYQPSFPTDQLAQCDQLFAQQKLGMIVEGTWIVDQNKELQGAAWLGSAVIPKISADGPDGSWGGGFGISVNNKSKYTELSVELAKLMLSPEFNSRLMTNAPVSKKSLAASTWMTDPIRKVEIEQYPSTRQEMPKSLFNAQVTDASYTAFAKAILGKLSVDDATKELDAAINKIVSK